MDGIDPAERDGRNHGPVPAVFNASPRSQEMPYVNCLASATIVLLERDAWNAPSTLSHKTLRQCNYGIMASRPAYPMCEHVKIPAADRSPANQLLIALAGSVLLFETLFGKWIVENARE